MASGDPGTLDYRLAAARADGSPASWWHDVPLRNANGSINMITEIPAGTAAKYEINTKLKNNDIAQDVKNGAVRVHPFPIDWGYGAFPQTWEDPKETHGDLAAGGDRDPLDAVELGGPARPTGTITAVVPVAALAMIDSDELDWKVIVVDSNDPRAKNRGLDTIEKVNAAFPGELDRIRTWFADYKKAGNATVVFGYGGEFQPRKVIDGVLAETHAHWQALVSGRRSNDLALSF